MFLFDYQIEIDTSPFELACCSNCVESVSINDNLMCCHTIESSMRVDPLSVCGHHEFIPLPY